jgi:hypothetical protein
MLAMWDRSAGSEFQAAHAGCGANMQTQWSCITSKWARGGLEQGEAHEISAQEDYTRSRLTHIKYIRSYIQAGSRSSVEEVGERRGSPDRRANDGRRCHAVPNKGVEPKAR